MDDSDHCSACRVHIRSNVPYIKSDLDREGTKPMKEARLTKSLEKPQRDDQLPKRSIRADAQRNEDALLEAAKAVFATSGVDAPVREIAAKASVGLGTLYRRFPTRADLIAAVFRREVDACTTEARALATVHPPGEALSQWLIRYTAFIATKKGLASALHSGDPAFETLPGYFRVSFEPALTLLLQAAETAGEIRPGVAPYDLLRAIGNLSVTSGDDGADHARRMVDLLLDGLRFGVTSATATEPT
jgi:AcrR family transcriptional regulator